MEEDSQTGVILQKRGIQGKWQNLLSVHRTVEPSRIPLCLQRDIQENCLRKGHESITRKGTRSSLQSGEASSRDFPVPNVGGLPEVLFHLGTCVDQPANPDGNVHSRINRKEVPKRDTSRTGFSAPEWDNPSTLETLKRAGILWEL